MPFIVVGLSGKAGSGKDYLAKTVLGPLGFKRVSFADHMKITAVGRGLMTMEEAYVTKPPHIRSALQQIGTEEGWMVFGRTLWVDTAYAWMQLHYEHFGFTRFAVPDVRFPHEVEGLQQRGDLVLRLHAPERVAASPLSDAARRHTSETALDDWGWAPEQLIPNDPWAAPVVETLMRAHLTRHWPAEGFGSLNKGGFETLISPSIQPLTKVKFAQWQYDAPPSP